MVDLPSRLPPPLLLGLVLKEHRLQLLPPLLRLATALSPLDTQGEDQDEEKTGSQHGHVTSSAQDGPPSYILALGWFAQSFSIKWLSIVSNRD